MSSGRTVKFTSPGQAASFALADAAPDGFGPAELLPDRYKIRVYNQDASNAILVGRSGGAFISLPKPGTSALSYTDFVGCALRELTFNDSGNTVAVAVDASDTLEERGRSLEGKKPPLRLRVESSVEMRPFWDRFALFLGRDEA